MARRRAGDSRRDSSSCAMGNATCCGKCGSSTILDSHYRRLGNAFRLGTPANGLLAHGRLRRGVAAVNLACAAQAVASGGSGQTLVPRTGRCPFCTPSIAIECLNAHPSRKSVRSANRRTSNAMIARWHPTPIPADVAARPGAWDRSRRATQTSRADTADRTFPDSRHERSPIPRRGSPWQVRGRPWRTRGPNIKHVWMAPAPSPTYVCSGASRLGAASPACR